MLAGIAEGSHENIELFDWSRLPIHSRRACERWAQRLKPKTAWCAFTAEAWTDCASLRGPLDAGNSGSTIRMLSGILAAQRFVSTIGGDESLSRRPMQRIMTPLAQMGARIEARENRFPPLTIHGGPLHRVEYTLPVASAQVKSCVLIAGLFADGRTTVHEPVRTRDHTELALREFGADVEVDRLSITVTGHPKLEGRELRVPGDLSSAAFFLVAALHCS